MTLHDLRSLNKIILNMHIVIVPVLTPDAKFKAINEKLLVPVMPKVCPASLQLTLSGDLA